MILAWLGLGSVPPEAVAGRIGAAGRMLVRDASIRSTTWSLVFYGLAAPGGFWLQALVNAMLAAAVVEVALVRLFSVPARRRRLLLTVLAAAS